MGFRQYYVKKIRISAIGNGIDARFVNKRKRLSPLNFINVTVTGNRNGLRNRNPGTTVFSSPENDKSFIKDFLENRGEK